MVTNHCALLCGALLHLYRWEPYSQYKYRTLCLYQLLPHCTGRRGNRLLSSPRDSQHPAVKELSSSGRTDGDTLIGRRKDETEQPANNKQTPRTWIPAIAADWFLLVGGAVLSSPEPIREEVSAHVPSRRSERVFRGAKSVTETQKPPPAPPWTRCTWTTSTSWSPTTTRS